MGNTNVKPYPRTRNKKQVHWKAASRPSAPGKPSLVSNNGFIPDVVKICWTKPENDGGSPILGYLVEHKRTGSPHWVRASPLNVQVPEIAVSGLEPGWRYEFRVRAENAVGLSDPSESSEPLIVTFQRSAISAPKFTQELQDTVALEDSKVEFTVYFLGQPAPTICWYKDGFEIFSSRRTRIVTEPDKSILTIHQSSLADEGEIKCTATNRAGHTSTKAKLTLEAPPSIRLPRQYEDGIIFEMGEDIKLKVTVAGRPTPLIFWSHDGETMQNDERHEIEFVEDSSIVRIEKARRNDRGEYQIRAVNKLGQDIASFLVTVTDKPTPPGKARVVMTLGRSVTLSWNSPEDDGGCKIGNYIVEYYRVGWNVWLKAATSRKLTTILGELIEGSQYKFRVKAESPYGVSEPSEESDPVFIPDHKRGITQPSDITRTPSPSSENKKQVKFIEYYEPEIPKRPERLKAKANKTPEASPRLKRKSLSPMPKKDSPVDVIKALNFDRASIARELAYGISEMKPKPPLPTLNISKSPSPQGPDTSSPIKTPETALLNLSNKSLRSFDIGESKDGKIETNLKTSPLGSRKRRLSLKSRNFSGSSEFMLVLCPEDEEGHNERNFPFEENSIPPPMSLSAPELGEEMEKVYKSNLIRSASSSELLNYRLLDRLNNEESTDHHKIESRRASLEVPKIQINSQEDEPIVGLDWSSKRRASDGGALVKTENKNQILNRKNSLNYEKASREEAMDKLSNSVLSRSKLVILNQRSLSQEREEEEFAKVRERMKVNKQASKNSIEIADEDKWLMDYEESIPSDEETETSLDERKSLSPIQYYREEEEEDTYHPRQITLPQIKRSPSDPFEILTVKKEPPDPNIVPKPILKKPVSPEPVEKNKTLPLETPHVFRRDRSHSLKTENIFDDVFKNTVPKDKKRRAFSLLPSQANAIKDALKNNEKFKNSSLPDEPKVNPAMNIGALAKLSSIAGAGIIVPKTMINKKEDEEEAKVVVDFYGDIVKSYGNKFKYGSNDGGLKDKIEKYSKNSTDNVKDYYQELYNKSNTLPPSDERKYDESELTNKPTIKTEKENQISHTKNVVKEFHKHEEDTTLFDYSFTKHQNLTINIQNNNEVKKDNLITTSLCLERPQKTKRERRSNSKTRSSSSVRQPLSSRNSLEREYTQQQSKGIERWESNSSLDRLALTTQQFSTSKIKTKNRKGDSNSSLNRPKSRNSRSRTSSITRDTSSRNSMESISSLPRIRPKLKEITTQTSFGMDFITFPKFLTTETIKNEELFQQAEKKVRGILEYSTDFAMLSVACWLYLFKNEYLAIPILVILVYRQLKEELNDKLPKIKKVIKKPIPNWILKKFEKICDSQ